MCLWHSPQGMKDVREAADEDGYIRVWKVLRKGFKPLHNYAIFKWRRGWNEDPRCRKTLLREGDMSHAGLYTWFGGKPCRWYGNQVIWVGEVHIDDIRGVGHLVGSRFSRRGQRRQVMSSRVRLLRAARGKEMKL